MYQNIGSKSFFGHSGMALKMTIRGTGQKRHRMNGALFL
jgi:hypothetical protein